MPILGQHVYVTTFLNKQLWPLGLKVYLTGKLKGYLRDDDTTKLNWLNWNMSCQNESHKTKNHYKQY